MSFSAILLISGVTYIAASLLCLCCPSILAPILDSPTNQSTKRPKLKDISLLRYGGHRGGGVERIENTIAAFDHSIDCGCSLLELDVRLTRDRLIVVTHDGDVIRTTGSSMGKISMIDYKDLPMNLATLSSPPPFSVPGTMTRYLVDASTNQQQYKHAYQMPLLDTVLERYPQAIINIDCKDDSLELADGIADLIEKHDAYDRVVVGSMHGRAMQRINQRLPQATKFYNPRAVLGLYLKYITGLLPFTRLSADILEIPYVTHEFRSAVLHMLSGRVGERVAGWLIDGLSWIMLRPSFVNHLQQRGVPVVVWVVNSEQEIKDALAKGVTGVMTDRPSLIKKMYPEAALRLQNHQPTSQRMQ